MPGIAAEHEALRRVAALVARGARHTELFAVAGQELAQLVQADAAALLRFEPDETITLLAAWNAAGAPAPVGDREPVNAELRRLRDTAENATTPVTATVIAPGCAFASASMSLAVSAFSPGPAANSTVLRTTGATGVKSFTGS